MISEMKGSGDTSWESIISSTNSKTWFKAFYSWSSLILLLIFAIALIVVFFLLNRTLKDNLLSSSMQKDKKTLNRLFGVFVFAYLLGAIYYFFFGQFNSFICSVVIRWTGQDFVAVVCDVPAAIAIFHLHHLSYKIPNVIKSMSKDHRDDEMILESPTHNRNSIASCHIEGSKTSLNSERYQTAEPEQV